MKDELKGIDIESRLDEPGQKWIREAVKALPEDTPSLAWRSELNAALRVHARRRLKLAYGWLWKPSAGLAVASCLALLVISRIPEQRMVESKPDIESALVNSYLHSNSSWELTGGGVTANEAQDVSGSQERDWYPEDVGATL